MKTFFLVFAFFSCCYSFAQITVPEEIKEQTMDEENTVDDEDEIDIEDEVGSSFESDSLLVVPEAWDNNFNNLLNSWYLTNHTNKLNHTGYQETVIVNDSIYADRLSRLPNIIELPYNETVRRCINIYIERRRNLIENMLGLESIYFPMIEETLDKYGLPLELKYLVIIESAMNPLALSKAGASGLWQFMLPTGKIYGLEINSLIDERRDPIKSTDAACRFLKDMYDTYGDWNLAIAAYNCGGGNVNKAIRRAGGKKDYWAIYPYLPKETRSYVPFFIAANYVMNYYAYHHLYPVQTYLPLATDTVMINQTIHFDQIAEILEIDKEKIRSLNPQYKVDIIPGNFKPQILTLPAIQAYTFVEKENEIASHRVDELFTNRRYVKESTTSNRIEKITHKVANKETVLTIADKYGVTAANIRKWNGLRSNRVAVGKNLILHIDNGGLPIRKTEAKPASPTSSSVAQRASASSSKSNVQDNTGLYKVQQGDSYYSIAQKFPGYSHKDLMKLNNVTDNALKVGQYIKVPKK